MTLKVERELVEARCAAAAAGDELFVRSCQLNGIAAVLTAVPCTVEVEEGWTDAEREEHLKAKIKDDATSSADARKIRLYLAWKGHAWSQFVLGYDFHFGDGVKLDYALARYWYGRAAEQGVAEAQNNLANLFVDGLGGDPDADAALSWYEKSWKAGDVVAAGNLGRQLVEGTGVKHDYRRAAELLKAYLAENPYSARSHYLLAECYRHGAGGRASPRLARDHYLEASDFGHAVARKPLRRLAREGRARRG
ncbi:MAG: sel1 repeat family protein, partial [Kiritimatiellae bacterium]|nr:sel1 repeat family protein [Kiritimatiellia bacterium]